MDQRVVMKKTQNALQRLDALEKVMGNIAQNTNQGLSDMARRVETVTELVDAMVGLLGEEQVSNAIQEARKRREEERIATEKRAIEALLESGHLAPAEVVGENSLLVGQETGPDEAVRVAWLQVPMSRLSGHTKDSLMGQKVGFVLTLPDGGKFRVESLYDFTKKEIPQAEAATEEVKTNTEEAKP